MTVNDDNEIFEALKGAADGAFVVDSNLKIQFWNQSAQKILGLSSSEVVGRHCFRILQGVNEQGQIICQANCPVSKLALCNKPVPDYDLRVRNKQLEPHWINLSIITLNSGRNGKSQQIVHLFRDLDKKKRDEIFFRHFLEAAQRYHEIPLVADVERDSPDRREALTRRQQEVLNFLARGFSTQEISEKLSISRNTTRNHIQRILQILQVHSRLEAVTYALKNNLVN
jgi:PAS domain S-box-containing protein